MVDRKGLRLPSRILLAFAALPGGVLLLIQVGSAFDGDFFLQDVGLFTILYGLASLVLVVIVVRGRL